MRIDREKCINCEACIQPCNEVCPVNAFAKDFKGNVIIREDCTNCGACQEIGNGICPVEAIGI